MNAGAKKRGKFDKFVTSLEADGEFTPTLLASALPYEPPSARSQTTAQRMIGTLASSHVRVDRLATLLDELVVADAQNAAATKRRRSA